MPHAPSHQMSGEMQPCIRDCLDCYSSCLQTVTHCLDMGGRHAEKSHIRLLLDCAEICQTAAAFMLRNSDVHQKICGVCAEVCQRCADDCERFTDDAQMKTCAEVCRRCAKSCRQMAKVAV